MADTTKNVMSLIATSSSRIKDLVIKNGQLIFIQDAGRIAFDFNNKRVFYNQIVELNTDAERQELVSPLNGYYFVVDTGVLWAYRNEWVQITSKPEEIVFVGVELPTLGQANKIYVNKEEREISIWDDSTDEYITISNYCGTISEEEVRDFFA